MNFTVDTIAQSLSAYLAPVFSGVAFYEDPNQQGTETPCMFLQQRYAKVKLQTGGRFLRTIGVDLTYLEDYNLPDLQRRYQRAAEKLDLVMETFPYNDNGTEGATLLRTYDRNWQIDDDGLHYKFEVRALVELPEEAVKMKTIQDYNEEVTVHGKDRKNGTNRKKIFQRGVAEKQTLF